MKNDHQIVIDNIRFTAASCQDTHSGLLGFIACTLNGSLLLDGLTLRRTRAGRFAISFPARVDGAGRQRYFLRPLDDQTRIKIERQILCAMGYPHESENGEK